MSARGYAEQDIEQLLVALEDAGALSDYRFAEQFIRSREMRGQGPVRIRAELARRGVAADIVDSQLDAGDRRWFAAALAARQKRFGTALPDTYTERARQMRHLAGRGFTGAHVAYALGGDDDDTYDDDASVGSGRDDWD